MKAGLVSACLAWAAAARFALGGDGFEAPGLESPNYWIAIGIAAGAFLAIVLVAFKNAHRTHLD